MHRVTVMGNADLSPTPFRPYATWLDEEPEVRKPFDLFRAAAFAVSSPSLPSSVSVSFSPCLLLCALPVGIQV